LPLQKELAGALNKYGKLLDKSFVTDVSKACRNIFRTCQEEDLNPAIINEVRLTKMPVPIANFVSKQTKGNDPVH
jgi:hypothetical protein